MEQGMVVRRNSWWVGGINGGRHDMDWRKEKRWRE